KIQPHQKNTTEKAAIRLNCRLQAYFVLHIHKLWPDKEIGASPPVTESASVIVIAIPPLKALVPLETFAFQFLMATQRSRITIKETFTTLMSFQRPFFRLSVTLLVIVFVIIALRIRGNTCAEQHSHSEDAEN
ncbi:MAG TPA: hypothetical protein DEA22_09545, partial [Blastocatellia bacterium]|nr:hypothetical protein [Blastocatellia bacterium]